jgi:hypothetical protein
MATPRASAPDFVTLASLHAALDSIIEIEELFGQIRAVPTADRLVALAAELRALVETQLSRGQRR